MNTDQVRSRFGALFGAGWQADFAAALDLTAPRLSDQFTQNRIRPAVIASLEFLEAMPRDQWPERWAKLAARKPKG